MVDIADEQKKHYAIEKQITSSVYFIKYIPQWKTFQMKATDLSNI
jgi:hypothetical protein